MMIVYDRCSFSTPKCIPCQILFGNISYITAVGMFRHAGAHLKKLCSKRDRLFGSTTRINALLTQTRYSNFSLAPIFGATRAAIVEMA